MGLFLKDRIDAHFKARGVEMVLRYFDPSYQIRGCAANTEDALLCDRMARHAVHAAMAGKTGLVISFLNGQFVHVPIAEIAQVTQHRGIQSVQKYLRVVEQRRIRSLL